MMFSGLLSIIISLIFFVIMLRLAYALILWSYAKDGWVQLLFFVISPVTAILCFVVSLQVSSFLGLSGKSSVIVFGVAGLIAYFLNREAAEHYRKETKQISEDRKRNQAIG